MVKLKNSVLVSLDRINCGTLLFCLLFFCGYLTKQVGSDSICGHPAVPMNAKVSLSNETRSSGTIATYTCDDGYELFGSSAMTCNPSGAWQGEMPFCGTNVALRRPANQSTTIRGGAAGNANDGEKTTVHDGKRCTETMKETSPWWKVDLLRPYPIKIVRVTTRGCCGHQPLQDLEIRVGNSTDLQRNPLCAWFPGTIEEGITKTFTCARTVVGQHVFLQLVGVEGSLSLCEVEVFSTDEFSNDRCAPVGVGNDVELAAFDQICYEFNVGQGKSFDQAREKCKANGGDLVHDLKGITNTFLLTELDRRKERLKTQLVWIGAQREPGFTSRTWKWVDGEVIGKPSWGKDQPNNYNGEQNCAVLDGGRNWLWNDVGCNLDYLHWICQHTPPFCGSPDKNLNTTIEGNDFKVGKTISYHCPEGHMLVGDHNRTCQSDGFWSGVAPTCKYVDCGKLGNIEHGEVKLTDGKTTYGAAATYSCALNYTLMGDARRSCGDGGVWSGDAPQCLFDWCADPPQIAGGTVKTSNKRTGSIATYSCEPGFILFGQHELTCGLGGEWSGKAPSCKYIDCGAPPNIDNGKYQLLNGTTTHSSLVEYSCAEDYWLEPPENRRQICTREGKWSAEPPACELITCPEPDVPAGGFVVGYDFNVHSLIEFHCEAGYLLKGNPTLTCTMQGEWSHEPPTCQYIDCGKLPSLPYGSVSYLNSTTHLESEVVYSCVHNYRISGMPRRKCLESQHWSGAAPKCEEIRCPEPILAEHSILSVTGNDRVYGRTLIKTSESERSTATYKIGALVKYRCERGYKIQGDPLSTCEDNGIWSGAVPECIYVDCGMPEDVSHGTFNLATNVTYYGAAVLYQCNENYELSGHARRLCLENGTWNSETPKCEEIRCKEPEVEGGLSAKVSVYNVGGVAHYSCGRGQLMDGNSTRVCLKTGQWSGKLPKCSYVDCKHPGPIENGRVIVMNLSTTYNSAVEYHCVPQYQRIGPYLRKCLEDGKWSGEEPRCQMMAGEVSESQTVGYAISVGIGVVLFLLILLGLAFLRLRKETPVKNTENVEGAIRKEEQGAAVTLYATLNGNGHPNNIYDNIHEPESMYDSPYEETSHYELSPTARRNNGAQVTINGVSVR